MATLDELKRLALNWSLVIKTIHPTIEVVVKGEPDTVETLLSVWETGDKSFAKPTEAQLLTALAIVEADATQADTIANVKADAKSLVMNIPDYASWSAQEMVDHINQNVTDLASAKLVLIVMARFIAAFRDELYPDLRKG